MPERAGGFFQMDNALFDGYARKVEPTGVAIYCLLARHANAAGECWPSLERICDTLGVAKATAVKYLKKLELYGLILIEGQDGDARRHRYRVLPLKPAEIGSKSEPISRRRSKPQPEIGSNIEPIAAPETEKIGSNHEPISDEDRFKSYTEIGSNFEPEEDLAKKTQSLSLTGEDAANAASDAGKPKNFRTQQALNIAVDRCCQFYRQKFRELHPDRPPPAITGKARAGVRMTVSALADADECDYKQAEAECMRVIGRYLGQDDPWIVGQAHDLQYLPGRLNAIRNGANGNGKAGSGTSGANGYSPGGPGGYRPTGSGGGAGRGGRDQRAADGLAEFHRIRAEARGG